MYFIATSNLLTRLLVNLTHLILEVNSLHAIADSR